MQPWPIRESGVASSQRCTICRLEIINFTVTKLDATKKRWWTKLPADRVLCNRHFYPSGPDWEDRPF